MNSIIGLMRKFNIQNRVAILLIFLIIIPSTIIFQISKLFSQEVIKGYLYNYMKLTQSEIETSIGLLVDDINMLSVRLLINNDIYNVFDQTNLNDKERRKRIKAILDDIIVHRDIVRDIVIVTLDGKIYRYADDDTLEGPGLLYIEEIRNSKIPVWGKIKKDIHNHAYILLGRRYRNFYTGQRLGYLIIYIKERSLYDIYKDMVSEQGYSFIMSNNNYIISHSNEDKIGSTVFDESLYESSNKFEYRRIENNREPVILTSHQFEERLMRLGVDWKIISIISDKKLFKTIYTINQYVIIIQIMMVIFAGLLSFYIAKNIDRPVAKLKEKLRLIGEGQIDVNLFENSRDEIWDLERSFNDMIVQIKDLIRKNNEEKEKQREAELKALQAQINPHFIYNTLDAIGWIAKIKKQEQIEKMVNALASFFRISLHKGDKFVTINEEIEHVKSYITVEQMRFPDKFEVEYDISEDILEYKILKIILQPLVENSIKHGIREMSRKGYIRIIGYEWNDDIRFEIIDDGIGFDINILKDENASRNVEKEYVCGYGIKNISERIDIEYGNGCGLKFYSQKGKGTRVEVRIKKKT